MSVPTKELFEGTEIPVLGLGTFEQEGDKCIGAVKLGLEVGYRHIDTAQVYGNQREVAEGIKGFPREELFIASKLQWDFLEPGLVEENSDKCLKELGVDYLDLFLIHWPNREKPFVDVFAKMLELKEKGKILNAGVSNFTIHHLQDIIDQGLNIAVNQVEFHPYLYQKDLLDFCTKNNIALTAYSPLARGNLFSDEVLIEIGNRYHKKPGQVSLKWLLQKGLIVIPKGSSREHLKENLDVFDFILTDEEMLAIDSLDQAKRYIDPPISEFNY